MLIDTKKWLFAILITVLLSATSIYAILRLNRDPILEGESAQISNNDDTEILEKYRDPFSDDEESKSLANDDEREIMSNDLVQDNVFITASGKSSRSETDVLETVDEDESINGAGIAETSEETLANNQNEEANFADDNLLSINNGY